MITAATVCMPAFMFLQAISNLFGVGGASVISGRWAHGICSGPRIRLPSPFGAAPR